MLRTENVHNKGVKKLCVTYRANWYDKTAFIAIECVLLGAFRHAVHIWEVS